MNQAVPKDVSRTSSVVHDGSSEEKIRIVLEGIKG